MKKKGVILGICFFLITTALGKIITLQGARYYQIGNNSFLVQPNGSIDEADASAIVNILKRYYREKEPEVASQVYADIHMVYKGPLLGDIYRLCLLSHVEYLITSVKAFDTSPLPIVSRYISHSFAGSYRGSKECHHTRYEHLHTNGPFDISTKKVTVKEYVGRGERGGISAGVYGLIARDSYCKCLDTMLSRIYDNSSIRDLYGPVEEALVHKLVEFNDYCSTHVPGGEDFVMPIYKVVLAYIKSPEMRQAVFFGLQKNDTAREYFKYGVELSTEACEVGIDLYRKGDYESCLKALNESVLMNDKCETAYYYRGLVYNKLGSRDKAVAELTVACKLNPRNSTYLTSLAWRYYEAENYLAAIEYATKALEVEPKHSSALRVRGWAYYRAKEYGKALDNFNNSIELDNTNADAFDGRARTFLELKMYDLALADANRAVELGRKVPSWIINDINAGCEITSVK